MTVLREMAMLSLRWIGVPGAEDTMAQGTNEQVTSTRKISYPSSDFPHSYPDGSRLVDCQAIPFDNLEVLYVEHSDEATAIE